MSDLLTPAEIEDRAARLDKTMTAVCDMARVGHATWYRWKAGTPITMRVYYRLVGAIQVLEEQREAAP